MLSFFVNSAFNINKSSVGGASSFLQTSTVPASGLKRTFATVLTALAMTLNLGGHAFSAVIYQDSFNRIGFLDGTSPTVNLPGSTYISHGPSGEGFYTSMVDGGYAYNVNGSNTVSNALAYLPLNMQPGIYSLSLTLKPNAGTTADWLSLGFTETAGNTFAQGFLPNGNPQLWLLYRDNGATTTFFGGGLANGLDSSPGTPGNAVRFTITLNSESGEFAFSDSANLTTRSGTLSAESLAKINYIGFSIYRNANGQISDLNLTYTPSGAVPEPASIAIFGLGALGLACRSRRKTKV